VKNCKKGREKRERCWQRHSPSAVTPEGKKKLKSRAPHEGKKKRGEKKVIALKVRQPGSKKKKKRRKFLLLKEKREANLQIRVTPPLAEQGQREGRIGNEL